MKKIGCILEDCFKDYGIQDPIKRNQALFLWPKIVGDEISKVTEPQRLSKGKLFVKVSNHSWRQEITFHIPEIIQKLNNEIGSGKIEEIILI